MSIQKIRTSTQKWNEVDVHELAQLAITAWKAKGLTLTVERLINWLHRLEYKFPPLAVLAYSGNNLAGWLLFYIQSSTEAEINPWALNGHPIVSPDKNEEIAAKLVEEAINLAKREGITRIEINYYAEKEELNQKYKAFYESLGMTSVEENVHMRTELSRQELESVEVEFPLGNEIKPITKVDEEKFFQCFYQTFRDSEDRWVSDKSDDEIRDYFNDVIHENPFPLVENASIALLENNHLIAFTVVRQSHGDENGQLWVMGVHPKHRRKGIGRSLILFVKKNLVEQGFRTMSLNVDLANHPAYQLYQEEGFKPEWCKINHAWKAGDER